MQTRPLGWPEEHGRCLQLTAPHAAPLADWVSGLRAPERWVPDLDPADGARPAAARVARPGGERLGLRVGG